MQKEPLRHHLSTNLPRHVLPYLRYLCKFFSSHRGTQQGLGSFHQWGQTMLFEVEHDECGSFRQGSSNNPLVHQRCQSPQAARQQAPYYYDPQRVPRQFQQILHLHRGFLNGYERNCCDVGRTLVASEFPLQGEK